MKACINFKDCNIYVCNKHFGGCDCKAKICFMCKYNLVWKIYNPETAYIENGTHDKDNLYVGYEFKSLKAAQNYIVRKKVGDPNQYIYNIEKSEK